jgi:sterol desaturase/sphingolipid hydroxylase (fatty acid hydroxylase superfamily)
LYWGLGTYAVTNLSFFLFIFIFEIAANHPEAEKYLINYSLNQSVSRRKSILETQKKLSFQRQFFDSAFSTLGPAALLNILVVTLLGQALHPIHEEIVLELFPSWREFLFHLLAMLLVSDLVLYWGHRIQHMNGYLWKHCHSYHHQIDTPTAISTASIDQTDATLQAGVPVLIALLVTRPHPVTFYVCLSLRFLDSIMNHSGLDFNQIPSADGPSSPASHSQSTLSWSLGRIALTLAWFLTLITFKNFPLRAPTTHHDYHHRYINFTTNSKNFGEYFVIWDQIFGTFSHASAKKQKK